MRSPRLAAGALLYAALIAAVGCGGGGGPSFALTGVGGPGGAITRTAALLAGGGETLVLSGAGFQDGAQVLFGDVPAVAVVFVSERELEAIAPVLPEGWISLTVRNPNGDQVVLDPAVFVGVQPALSSVTAVDPDVVPGVDGGTLMAATGTNLRDGAQVFVDDVESGSVTFVDETTLHFDLPPRALEADVDMRVVNPGGFEVTLPAAFFQSQAWSLAPQPNAATDAQIRHLLQRAGFGASPDEQDRRFSNDISATASRLLQVAIDADTQRVEDDAWALFGDTPPPSGDIPTRAPQDWWTHLMRHNPNPLQERLAWFLHDHFATSRAQFGADRLWWMVEQIQLFRRFSMARADGGFDYNWRDLLIAVSKDRAMLDWLDGIRSRKGAPNENFSRELWELFMLGEGNGYTQADIVEAARAFTGFVAMDVAGTNYDTVRFEPTRHDEGQKTVLGVTGYFGYDDLAPYYTGDPATSTDPRDTDGGIVALTLRERPVEASRWICRKLLIYFLYEEPREELVDDLAQVLRDNDWNMRPMLERMLRSKAMFSRETRKSRIKMPVEFVLGFLRNTDADYIASRIRTELTTMQQLPMEPPDVDGWPRGEAWMGGQAMLERINFLRNVVEQLDDTATQIEPLIPPVGSRSPAQLVDHLATVLDVELTPETRAEFEAYCSKTLSGDVEVDRPFDPTDERMLREKVRGLLYLIGQYHDHQRD